MIAIQMMWSWAKVQAHEASRKAVRNERGASTLELVIISALVAAVLIGAIAIIRAKVNGTANSIPTR